MITTTQPSTLTLNPRRLRPHPALALLPRIPVEPAEAQAFQADIEAQGLLVPVLVDADHRLLDGQRRVEAASTLGFGEIECRVVGEHEAVRAILSGFIHRRHLTKSAVAYLSFPLIEPALEEARARKLACLRRGDEPRSAPVHYGEELTAEGLANQLGIARRTFFYAADLHKRLAGHDELRAQVEEAIFVDGAGLGALIAGLAGKEATDGKPRPQIKQLALFTEGFRTLRNRFAYWTKFDATERKQALQSIRETVLDMPDDLRAELVAELAKLSK